MARLVYFLRLAEHGYKMDKKGETPPDKKGPAGNKRNATANA